MLRLLNLLRSREIATFYLHLIGLLRRDFDSLHGNLSLKLDSRFLLAVGDLGWAGMTKNVLVEILE